MLGNNVVHQEKGLCVFPLYFSVPRKKLLAPQEKQSVPSGKTT